MNIQQVTLAVKFLKAGELVGIPTETVYGLAANALDPEAVLKIFEAKNRPHFDPLIVHIPHGEALRSLVSEVPRKAYQLAEAFWPGALTMVLPKSEIVPDLVTSGMNTVAIRVPDHALTLELLKRLDFPLAAPSANPFGYISPTRAEHVAAQLGDKVALILDGGPSEVGIESTIISVEGETPEILRLGGISPEAIEEVIGPVKVAQGSSSNPKAPGMLSSHYAPRKPTRLLDEKGLSYWLKQHPISEISLLRFREARPEIPLEQQYILSPKGDLREAAQRLFGALRQLDQGKEALILAELVPETGLGRAINDRLRRATA